MTSLRPILLIVDDEPEVLRSLHDLFRLEYRVLTAERGEEALRLLTTHDVHVILTDQRMPDMSGVELLREASRLRPDTTRLMFTGYADISAVIDAINQGNVFRYIAKPWDVPELQTIVRQAFERHLLIVDRQRLIVELEETNARLEEANRLKQRFIEVASHELNTPVSVVLGLAELWILTQGPQATAEERNWMDRIQQAGRRLASSLERMWTLLQANRFDPLDAQPTDLGQLVQTTLIQLEPFVRDRRQRIELRLEPNLGLAEIDPAKIGDALANLLINAIKFSPDGGVIHLTVGTDASGMIRFEVTDSGVGIRAEDHRHLFEPFFTGGDTRHHSSGQYQFGKRGIGLGLCLVKTFVELHGGQVFVESEPNRGSTFGFRMPRKLPGNESPTPSPDPQGPTAVVDRLLPGWAVP
jgi:signal transduction histidine kinase